jgi:putative transposase
MALRQVPLITGEYYHIFNRGVARQPIFFHNRDYERFLLCLQYNRFNDVPYRLSRWLKLPKEDREALFIELTIRNDPLVEIITYCLMPNHFHLLLKQTKEGGISKFMKSISDSFTKFLNTKYERVGPIFQGAFKNVHIDTDEQLVHLSRYIHINPRVSAVVAEKDFFTYPWSSLHQYLGLKSGFSTPETILNYFSSPNDYRQFLLDQVDYGRELEKIKHLILDD